MIPSRIAISRAVSGVNADAGSLSMRRSASSTREVSTSATIRDDTGPTPAVRMAKYALTVSPSRANAAIPATRIVVDPLTAAS